MAETAREGSRLLRRDARKAAGGSDRDGDDVLLKHLHFQVKKPDQVLVRLKVEHSGFTTLHNQRFGSQFVNNLVSTFHNTIGFKPCIQRNNCRLQI